MLTEIWPAQDDEINPLDQWMGTRSAEYTILANETYQYVKQSTSQTMSTEEELSARKGDEMKADTKGQIVKGFTSPFNKIDDLALMSPQQRIVAIKWLKFCQKEHTNLLQRAIGNERQQTAQELSLRKFQDTIFTTFGGEEGSRRYSCFNNRCLHMFLLRRGYMPTLFFYIFQICLHIVKLLASIVLIRLYNLDMRAGPRPAFSYWYPADYQDHSDFLPLLLGVVAPGSVAIISLWCLPWIRIHPSYTVILLCLWFVGLFVRYAFLMPNMSPSNAETFAAWQAAVPGLLTRDTYNEQIEVSLTFSFATSVLWFIPRPIPTRIAAWYRRMVFLFRTIGKENKSKRQSKTV